MRIMILVVLTAAVVLGCKNEPYQDPTLTIGDIRSKAGTIDSGSVSYRYHAGKLYTFTSSKTGSIMTFNYIGENLLFAIDTTSLYRKFTRFYGWGSSKVIDSTILYTDTLTSLYSVRTITYDDNKRPSNVNLKLFTKDGVVEQAADLTWQDGNVVRLVTTNITKGTTRDLAIEYDDGTGAYASGIDYVYTLSLAKLYWLSKHNPILFTDTAGPKKYTYVLNKFGYPASFKNEFNTFSTVTYFSSDDNE